MEDWESLPLFAPQGASIPRVDEGSTAEDVNPALGALAHLLYDEDTPEEISEDHRDHGNRLLRRGRGYVKPAIAKYTEAIEANCDIPAVTAAAYSNRAAAHLKLKNYRNCLVDCVECLKLEPGNIKANYRAGMSCVAIGKYEDAIAYCNSGIGIKGCDNAQKLAFYKLKQGAQVARKREEDSLARAEARKNTAEQHAATRRQKMQERGIVMGMPLLSQQRSYKHKEAAIRDGKVYWPVLLVYPEEAIGVNGTGDQSDYLEQVSEDATLQDLISIVFPNNNNNSPEWDRRGIYKKNSSFEVLFRQEWTLEEEYADSDDETSYVGSTRGPDEVGAWRSLDLSHTLRKAISTRGYVVPLFPVFFVVPKGTYLS